MSWINFYDSIAFEIALDIVLSSLKYIEWGKFSFNTHISMQSRKGEEHNAQQIMWMEIDETLLSFIGQQPTTVNL